jgi:selenocysteine lyase/cysteine desulfurase
VVLNTLLEHTSNDLPWRMIPQFSLLRLQVDSNGFVDLKELDSLLYAYNQKGEHGMKRIRLVAISGASNVLGSFNNLAEISSIAHKYGAHLLVDAAQLIAHRKVEVENCGIDYLAFSGHKVYAPFGSGVLVVRKGLLNFSQAEMELIQSSGEENSSGIAALGKAMSLLKRIGLDTICEEEQVLTSKILYGLAKIKGLRIYGLNDPASSLFVNKGGVIVFTMKGLLSERIARELSLQGGIGVRCGCHCAHILVKHILGVSPGLERFQRIIFSIFTNLRAPGVVRVSLGIGNTEEDVDILIHVLGKIAVKSQASGETKQKINDFVKAAKQRVYS